MTGLIATSVATDPRVAQARALLVAAQQAAASRCTGVRPPNPALANAADTALSALGEARGAPTWYRYLGSGFGTGPLVELVDGSVKYDCISGIGVHGLGHGHPDALEAAITAGGDVVMQGHLQQNQESLSVSQLLLAHAADAELATTRVLLTTSGAMANENALKLAMQARRPAARVLAFAGNFAGRTLAMAAVSDKPAYRDGLPLALSVDYLPYPRAELADDTPSLLRHLDRTLARYPGQHAAIIIEPVQGEGGFYPPNPILMRQLLERCRAAGVVVISDEIQTFGRLVGGPFASAALGFGDLVDVITVGKQTQVCATLFRPDLQPRPGLISQTFTGATHALLTSAAWLKRIRLDGWCASGGPIDRLGQRFRDGLSTIAPGPYGIGGMLACCPCDGDRARVLALCQDLFTHGVIAFVAGAKPTRLRFLPPLGVMTATQVDDILSIVRARVEAAG